MTPLPPWFAETLAWQLESATQTWSLMKQNGLSDDTVLKLDFFFDAADEESASRLKAFLDAQTDYESTVGFSRSGLLRRREWHLNGTTQPTRVSQEFLLQWIEWMVTAGAHHGPARFDGFGAGMPR